MGDPSISIGKVLDNEGGGFVEEDGGRGPSRWGITLKTANECGLNWTAEDIRNLTRGQAAGFYFRHFWLVSNIGLIQDQELDDKLLDLAVNLGIEPAVKLLQRAVGVPPDGILWLHTAGVVNAIDPKIVLAKLRVEATAYYEAIVAANPAQAKYLPEWLGRLERA